MSHYICSFACILVLAVATTGNARAQMPEPPIAVVQKMIDTFNRGDMDATKAMFADDAVMIDEVTPGVWQGPGAVANFLTALDADSKVRGRTDESLKLGAVKRSDVNADSAYIVTSTTYAYKEHGQKMSQAGGTVYVLHKAPAGWKIESFTWVGGKTVPVK